MTSTETITNNFDHQTSLSPVRRQAPYDLQPKIGHTYGESPSHTRPSSGFQRSSYSTVEDHHQQAPEPPSRRPKTTHVSSPRKKWSPIVPEDAPDPGEEHQVPPSPSIRPMTSIYRRPGQQFSNESSEMLERSRSRNQSRNHDYNEAHQEESKQPVEVQGYSLSNSPTRRQNYDDIQPKIGHYYSRSPSPPMAQNRSQRPMTSISRSSSRNAMTQVDLRNNSLSTTNSTQNFSSSGRGSPPNRGYIEITGRESRAEMKQSQTTPNLNSYNNEYDYNGRRLSHSYSRHLNNGNESGSSDPDQQPNWSRNRSNLKPAMSLSLLPLAREAQNHSFKDKYNRPGSDWNLTTTKRSYRFSEEGFKHARAQPYRPSPSLKIAIEGKRYLSPEKKDVFVRFAHNRPSRSARQDALPTPPMSNPLFGHAPQHTQYDEIVPLQPGYTANRQDAGYGRADTGFRSEPLTSDIQTTRRRESLNTKPDTRFVQGTTTKSTFREPAAEAFNSEKWRPRPIIPPTTLRMEGEITRKTTSTKEEFPARPYCRQAPTPRLPNLSVSTENISSSSETTYRVSSASVLGSPLKRALRHDPHLRRSDSIDWM